MKIVTTYGTFRLGFKYQKMKRNGSLKRTGCFIFKEKNDGSHAISIGWSQCHKNDVFKKKIGRKIALERALHDIGLYHVIGNGSADDKRSFRAQVWQQYFERTNS